MKVLFRTLVAVAASLVSTAVYAQGADTYPNRPVRVIVGFTAGGPTDVIARLIGAEAVRRARPAVLRRERPRRGREYRGGADGPRARRRLYASRRQHGLHRQSEPLQP